jgi:predicted HTH transcriptional regulator
MKDSIEAHKKEFEETVGNISQAMQQISDPVAIATMLFSIAEERKSTNLVIREINGKLDKYEQLMEKLDKIAEKLDKLNTQFTEKPTQPPTITSELSERDEEVLGYVKERGRICADELQEKFDYRGRNAASARLSKLFKEGKLDKVFVGRKVYYTTK